jgi:FKBP-type peptidyl-prolyl cis-trans isomerase
MDLLRHTVFGLLLASMLYLVGCHTKSETKSQAYTLHKKGFRYRLLSFTKSGEQQQRGDLMKLSVTFSNQRDSVFWDNVNNLGEDFVVDPNRNATDDRLNGILSAFTVGDSACVLMKADEFFLQQFKSAKKPWFSQSDSVVKVNFRIKERVDGNLPKGVQKDKWFEEENRIRRLFLSDKDFELAKDPNGFYWLERKGTKLGAHPQFGDRVLLQYQGCFLNGRILDQSAGDFEMVYGTPDQLLLGLNYVIGSLKVGENAKIVLPSRLAFGEKGSSNGTVPPYTPLVYTLTLKEIKKTK